MSNFAASQYIKWLNTFLLPVTMGSRMFYYLYGYQGNSTLVYKCIIFSVTQVTAFTKSVVGG